MFSTLPKVQTVQVPRAGRPELTIFSLPIGSGPYALPECFWLAALRGNFWLKRKPPPVYGGHYAVTRSLVEGMAKAHLPVTHNPSKLSDVAERVHVLGVRPLRQMIRWKKAGLIKQLTCGPNVVVRSSENGSVLASPEIDAVINHVDWACDFWGIDHPELRTRCLCWAAGVDGQFWKPPSKRPRSHILVFDKRGSDQDPGRIRPYIAYLEKTGWPVDVITRSGQTGYNLLRYRELLHRAALMVGFTVGSESPGIAWSDACAANVKN